jgi:hypothetical protein
VVTSIASSKTLYTLQLNGKSLITNFTATKKLKCITMPSKHYTLVFKDQYSNTVSSAKIVLGNGGIYVAVLKDSDRNGTQDIHIYKEVEPRSVSVLWQIPQYFVITSGEIMFSITGMKRDKE